jgi:hypothetical protein
VKKSSKEAETAFTTLVDMLTRLETHPSLYESPLVPLVLYPTLYRALHLKGGDKYPTLAGVVGAVASSATFSAATESAAEALQQSTVKLAEIPGDIDWSTMGLVSMSVRTYTRTGLQRFSYVLVLTESPLFFCASHHRHHRHHHYNP